MYLALKIHLENLKAKVDDLDVDKLKNVPAGSSKLSNVFNNDVEKTVYDKLIIKIDAVDTKIPSTSGLVTIIQDDSDKQGPEKKIEYVDKKLPYTSRLVKNTDCNTKITDIENKIPSFTRSVTTAALNTKTTEIENKIPDTKSGYQSCSEHKTGRSQRQNIWSY